MHFTKQCISSIFTLPFILISLYKALYSMYAFVYGAKTFEKYCVWKGEILIILQHPFNNPFPDPMLGLIFIKSLHCYWKGITLNWFNNSIKIVFA